MLNDLLDKIFMDIALHLIIFLKAVSLLSAGKRRNVAHKSYNPN